ncbi:MAG: hypothetical protein LC780_14500 [Acidobacteria bacterium]|nr:hypothetical protein [Acidobacteriota bacterium]
MKPLARFGVVLALLVLLVSLVPAAAGACPLCRDAKADTDYAGGTASLPNGFYYSILFMVCAPFAVVGGLVTRIVLARRRLRLDVPPVPAGEGPDAAFLPGSAGSRP